MLIYPSKAFTFGVHCGVPSSLHAGKMKCCMCLLNNMQIYFSIIGFIDSNWSNLNTPGSRLIYLLKFFIIGVQCGMPFPLHAWKGKFCMHLVNNVENNFSLSGFIDHKWSNLSTPGSYIPWKLSLLVSTVGCPFLCMQEKGKGACGLLIKWKYTLQSKILPKGL